MAQAIVTAPVIYTTAAGTGGPLLWNPPTSEVNAVILGVSFGITVVTTVAAALGLTGNSGQTVAPSSTTAIDGRANLKIGGAAGACTPYRVGTVAVAGAFLLPFAHLHTGALTVDNVWHRLCRHRRCAGRSAGCMVLDCGVGDRLDHGRHVRHDLRGGSGMPSPRKDDGSVAGAEKIVADSSQVGRRTPRARSHTRGSRRWRLRRGMDDADAARRLAALVKDEDSRARQSCNLDLAFEMAGAELVAAKGSGNCRAPPPLCSVEPGARCLEIAAGQEFVI